jgi:hypothetical protein
MTSFEERGGMCRVLFELDSRGGGLRNVAAVVVCDSCIAVRFGLDRTRIHRPAMVLADVIWERLADDVGPSRFSLDDDRPWVSTSSRPYALEQLDAAVVVREERLFVREERL